MTVLAVRNPRPTVHVMIVVLERLVSDPGSVDALQTQTLELHLDGVDSRLHNESTEVLGTKLACIVRRYVVEVSEAIENLLDGNGVFAG